MIPELEVQKAIRERLVGNQRVIDLVPATHILDTNQRPAPMPSIILGESQSVDEGTSIKRTHWRIYHTLHLWVREPSLERVKALAGAIRAELRLGRLALPEGLHCTDLQVAGMRFLRDPEGEHSHGVVTLEILLSEVTP
ncbi:DUF3168 domain-containing protein [Paracoccus sp. SM22M-07]|uniref:DUF3168 domain-containing protein n=1 Tax=Paracoccus sp. SM22M-07 TaxID=1520813 RepID=UPI0009182CC2|nr:DUF3168 domain-containing protein [Paracoccus sp. SM22M-07]OJH45838.1 hypothetical protein IE00_00925 [Paracoccus sp. SM22M-07]